LYWQATAYADGRPHVRPILAIWLDEILYFVSQPTSRKARNLAAAAECTVTLDADDAHLVVEGTAERVADEAVLQRVAAAYLSKYAWEVTVREGVFDADYGAPTAGPPPYALYQLRPSTVFAFGADETWSPTRYRF
jgi:hypothetical protein